MPKVSKEKLQAQILKEHNIVPIFQNGKKKTIPLSFNTPRTYAMKLLEIKFGKPIELIISVGTLDEVASTTGVERSTISKWRDKLGINFSEYRLPSCAECTHASYECVSSMHICTLLRMLGRKDLISLKKKELEELFTASPPIAPESHTLAIMEKHNEGR